MTSYAFILCRGRPVDDEGNPSGPACRNVIRASQYDLAPLDMLARARGWKLGPTLPDGMPDAMCPTCARPDTATTAILDRLRRSIRGGAP